MRWLTLLGFVAAVLCAVAASAGDYTPQQIRAAREFEVHGIRLGIPLADFLKRYAEARHIPEASDSRAGEIAYVRSNIQEGWYVTYLFFEDRLYLIVITYSEDDLRRMGGNDVPFLRLVERFGNPDEVRSAPDPSGKTTSLPTTFWEITAASRRIMYNRQDNGMVGVAIMDTTAAQALKKKKVADAKVGF
ncbi:MAG: hypothetical protein ACYC35_22735 [Pirellulales bacterium]